MAALAELEASIRGVAEGVGPAVVGLGRGWGLGTGVVVAEGRVPVARETAADIPITLPGWESFRPA